MSVDEVTRLMGVAPVALRTNGTETAKPVGATPLVLLRADETVAYPVVDGIPVLLAPEALGRPDQAGPFDLAQPAFEEAYLEMDFYNEVGASEAANVVGSEGWVVLDDLVRRSGGNTDRFLSPPEAWLDAVYDAAAQADAYRSLVPLADRTFVQIGGKGVSAIKFLLGGAAEAWLVTPMLGEARCALALAAEFGVLAGLRVVVGVAEQLPTGDGLFDGIFVGGSMHHMETELAMPEMARVLTAGGVFTAVEPFRAPLYGIGTRLLGKREANAHCSPLDESRIRPFIEAFDDARVVHHGALTRYALLALWKAGVRLSFRSVWSIVAADDRLSSRLPPLRRSGSSISLIGTNRGATPR